jgi:hypothetical protein
MTITYREKKGAPLTSEEVDSNFRELDTRLKQLEENPPQGEGVARVIQEGDRVRVMGTHGRELGCFTLPKVFPTPRGDWQPQTPYRGQDWVSIDGHVYACHTSHTSRDNFDLTNWEKIL